MKKTERILRKEDKKVNHLAASRRGSKIIIKGIPRKDPKGK